MWRVQGFVGRVFSRCHGGAPLRLSQSHHVEDELVNSSTLLSTSRHSSDTSYQTGEDEEGRRKKRRSQFCYAELPRYTALDAVGWGAATVLFMQMCRRIHSRLSSGSEPSPNPAPGGLEVASTLHKCGYRILLEILSRRDVLPRGRGVLCLQGTPERHNQPLSQASSSSSSTSSDASLNSGSEDDDHLTADSSFSDHQRAGVSQDSHAPEEALHSSSCPPEHLHAETDCRQQTEDNEPSILSEEERLAGAALNLKHVADSSVPVILNIIGLESAKSGDLEEAFSCFLASARHGYSKAQFNAGVCCEKGRGTGKDREKALVFYRQAAAGGHSQAQYRCAKLLLSSRGQQSTEELDTAIGLLEQAAAAGLTEAQVYLGSVYSQEPVRDGRKSVHYLKMAAERGDDTALLFLGQCYESGFGVQHNLRRAVGFYKQAAQAGNRQAQSLLMPPCGAEDGVLRSIRSAPCFSMSDRLRRPPSSPASPAPAPSSSTSTSTNHPSLLPPPLPSALPHSWSTGSLGSPPHLSSLPLHLHPHPQARGSEGGPCRWTIG